MNSMSKKLAIYISASAIALTLIAIILYEFGYISDLKQTILNKDEQLATAEQNLLEKDAIIADLDAQLQVYRDSVQLLQLENQQLKEKIESLKGTVSKLSLTIKKHDDKVRELTAEINRLNDSDSADKRKIAALEAKRDELLKEIEKQDHERMALKEQQKAQEAAQRSNSSQIEKLNAQVESAMDQQDPAPLVPMLQEPTQAEPLMEQTPTVLDQPAINQAPGEIVKPNYAPEISPEMQSVIVNRQAQRLMSVVSKTTVQFNSISLRNKEGSSEVKKIKKNDNEWRYTYLDFDLNNIDREVIMDEFFIIQIFDLDNNKVIPYNEKNPVFPESEIGAGGFKFKYDGKPVSVRYINTQEKQATNFELRLLYVNKKGLTFPLANGTKRLITEGRVAVD